MAAGLAVVVAVVWTVLWATSPHHGTVSTPAAAAVPAPPDAGGLPAGFTEAWRAASGATPAPVVAGPVVVTGDGDAVTGRDALTGEVRWSYTRDIPLCTVGAGFPDNEGGRALALYRNGTWCSELTSLHPDTGTRDRQRNPDVRAGHPPPRRRVAGHGDGPDLPRGVPVGPGAHRRVRRRAHAPAGRPPAPPELRVDGLRRDVRAAGRAAALPGRAGRTG